jgi:splicing factor U2AF subunit
MAVIGGNTAGPGDAVCSVCMNHEQRSALVEFRVAEEASNAMALDGILFEGVPVKVRRPADYNPSQAAAMGPSQPSRKLNLAAVGLTAGSAGGGLEDPDRIFVGGLPYFYSEAQVRELLESFGPLRGFELVTDMGTGNSKGYAFCVYMDTTVTDIACAALNGIKMGDKTLIVRRANQGASQPRPEQESILLQAQQQVQLQVYIDQLVDCHTRHLYSLFSSVPFTFTMCPCCVLTEICSCFVYRNLPIQLMRPLQRWFASARWSVQMN